MLSVHLGGAIGGPASAGPAVEGAIRRLASTADIARSRIALWATVLAFAGLMWLVPRLPMVDLPQHAGQVGLLRDLLLSASPWSELLRIDLRTPYLVGYAVALPLSFFMLPGTALKVVLTASFFGFIAASIALRKEVEADERLDWLFLPSFFSFSWMWGFYTFLVVAPLMVVMAHLAYVHARTPSFRTAAWIVAVGLVLLLGHGLAFVFACAVGGAVVLSQARSIRGLVVAQAPFALLGVALVAFAVASKGFDAPVERFMWAFAPGLRLLSLFVFSHGFTADLAFVSGGLLFAPLLMGLRINWLGLAPLAVLFVWVMVIPQSMLGAGYFFERFGLLGLVFFALIWRRAPESAGGETAVQKLAALLLVAGAWTSLAVTVWRLEMFSREAADFEPVLAAAEPGKRALAINMDAASSAIGHDYFYMHYAVWYQSEKGGLVDFNFANFHNMIVRYRPEHRPAVRLDFEWKSEKVDWKAHNARIYDYFFVRHGTRGLPATIVDNGECRIETVVTSGAWTLLKRGACERQQ